MNEIIEHLQRYIISAKKSNKKVALLFIDLDGFKSVNDNFGHEASDIVLKEVAQRMLDLSRDDSCIGRIGGDEFIVIIPDVTEIDLVNQLAKSLIESIGKPFNYNGNQIKIGLSVGISLFPDDADSVDHLRRLADKAMYNVKKMGKNNYCFINQYYESQKVS